MKLADYLRKENLSARDFAGQIAVTPEAVRLYLRGKRIPRSETMLAIHLETRGAVTPDDFYAVGVG